LSFVSAYLVQIFFGKEIV